MTLVPRSERSAAAWGVWPLAPIQRWWPCSRPAAVNTAYCRRCAGTGVPEAAVVTIAVLPDGPGRPHRFHTPQVSGGGGPYRYLTRPAGGGARRAPRWVGR